MPKGKIVLVWRPPIQDVQLHTEDARATSTSVGCLDIAHRQLMLMMELLFSLAVGLHWRNCA